MNPLAEARRNARTADRVQIKEATETRTILFEWPLTNLKAHFDSSKSDTKSKVIKSVPFGGGRWTVLFYAQSGMDQFCSLYLNAEPSLEERSQAIDYRGSSVDTAAAAAATAESGAPKEEKWAREGLYGFTFQIQTIDRATILGTKEAHDHAFSDKTSNWGWAQFAKRDVVYYNNSAVRNADAFLISVSVIESPEKPKVHRPVGHTVPPVLIQAMGSLLDDPDHSDIVFVIQSRRRTPHGNKRPKQKIYAIKKILAARCEYFRDMFDGGFLEAETVETSDEDQEGEDEDDHPSRRATPSNDRQQSPLHRDTSHGSAARQDAIEVDCDLDDGQSEAVLDDSDEELEFQESQKLDLAAAQDPYQVSRDKTSGGAHNASSEDDDGAEEDDEFVDEDEVIAVTGGGNGGGGMLASGDKEQSEEYLDTSSSFAGYQPGFANFAGAGSSGPIALNRDADEEKDVRIDQLAPKCASGASGKGGMGDYRTEGAGRQGSIGQNLVGEVRTPPKRGAAQKRSRANTLEAHGSGKPVSRSIAQKKRRKVIVRDSAYLTFKALLYYLYTDTVEFSPLTSSFLSSDAAAEEFSSGSGVCMANGSIRWGSTSTDVFNEEMRKAHAM
ncbi:hypothetical protein ACQY0O_006862 [Thecaphora frezii]